MTENNFDEDDLFESRRDDKNEYSTFIEELQQSTEKLMNEVFHSQYVPRINSQDLNLNDLDFSRSSKQSALKSITSKKNFTSADFNNSKRSTATRCTQKQKQLSESFVNFIVRNQKWKERRLMRAQNQHNRKQEQELKKLTFIPTILNRNRQKVIEPIYQRCLNLQKQKETKIAIKRIQKERQQDKKQSQYTFQPQIITKTKNRSLQEYLKDKEDWNQKRVQYLQNQRLWQQTKKTEQCIFRPILIPNKYNMKNNSQKQIKQRVEDRLLRSLQKSLERKQQIKKSTQVLKPKNVK